MPDDLAGGFLFGFPGAIGHRSEHASAAMTLDVYADLFDEDLDAVSVALDEARTNSNVGKMWADGLSTP
jgi:hypothetical protein